MPIYGQPFFTSEAEVERSSKGDTGPIEKYTIKSRVYFFVIYLVVDIFKGAIKMDETSSSCGSKKFFPEEKKISMDCKVEKKEKNQQK